MGVGGGVRIFVEFQGAFGQFQGLFGEVGTERGGLHVAQVSGAFYVRDIHRHDHQGVVHDFDHIGIEFLSGIFVADDVALKGVLVHHTRTPLAGRAEVVEKCDGNTVYRFVLEKVHKPFTLGHHNCTPFCCFN